jgi:hypothetical protein
MYRHLESSQKILISGCGGGYDIFCGLDLFFNLHDQNKDIILGSYTFTDPQILHQIGKQINPYCYQITHQSQFNENEAITKIIKEYKTPPQFVLNNSGLTKDEYFLLQFGGKSATPKIYCPEYKLVKNLYEKYHIETTIYCFIEHTIPTLIDSYHQITQNEKIDTIILVDGGIDSLMTGNEKDSLGTPLEDICNLVAVNTIEVPSKYLYCLGFNVELNVKDEYYFKNTSQLIKDNGLVCVYMLNHRDISTHRYIDVFMSCDPENSIVNTSVILAIQGEFGQCLPPWMQYRLGSIPLQISPLMALYWCFDLNSVCQHLKYDVNGLINAKDEYEINQLLKYRE